MRVIKFRGWQPSENKMHYEGHFHFDKDGIVGLEQGVSWIGRLDIVPMQFTGLKDREGKEIWEGDVLGDLPNGPRYEVIFSRGGFAATYTSLNGSTQFPIWDKTEIFEVLGNIHENPELLK